MRTAVGRGIREVARGVGLFLCLGALGAIWLLPSVRRRRARRAAHCRQCARNGRIAAVVIPCCAVLLLAGAAVRAQAAAVPLTPCNVHVYANGAAVPEPEVQLDVDPTWDVSRRVVLAGVSGLALAGGRVAGMDECQSSQPILFWRPPATSAGGSVIGETFLAWDTVANGGRASERNGFGISREDIYLRFGPNIAVDRAELEALAGHESVHVDQAATLTSIGGPLTMPLLYSVDNAFFPLERNHFERAAGLDAGGYTEPPDGGPDPQWSAVAAIVVLLVLLGFRRLRWLSRVAAQGGAGAATHEPGRCPRHSRGWFRPR
ncbi:hypothetical protein GCM10011512_24320 [Tersicoccus solisilvae]|uniref:DUF4157 domain-containing protein n=1 Tax=Tersicoccus solisilvae TaxID=1882339 RepID=A0ABQ1PFW7_9MICC|nr:hypothetical protein [Tersicoccus solisilvae]GGC96456.1 hypothetical protein GCM10011512_24320 [Tersicoccus solisilvae]